MILFIKNWFIQLSKREKILIIILAFLSIIIIGYYGIYRPLDQRLSYTKERHENAVISHANIKSKVKILRSAGDAGAQNKTLKINVPLNIYIAQSAAELGLLLEKNEELGAKKVNIVIGSARPKVLFPWLSKLENAGIDAMELDIKASDNGAVKVQAILLQKGET